MRAALATKVSTFHEQMDKAKADAEAEFRTSQTFIDACGVYYGDRFNDCLKQVGSVYPNLDLSKITFNYLVSMTPGVVTPSMKSLMISFI